jgi:hypothetical protein
MRQTETTRGRATQRELTRPSPVTGARRFNGRLSSRQPTPRLRSGGARFHRPQTDGARRRSDWVQQRHKDDNLRARITGSNTVDTIVFDLHGYDTSNIEQSCLLEEIVEQAWQTGAKSLDLIHGHGRNRALRRPFANTNTGFLGLAVRVELRHSTNLRQWIKSSTLNCKDPGVTSVRLKPNPAPTRTGIDHSVLAPRPHASVTDGWAARYP